MISGSLYRLTAFSSNPKGGNPAGVWIGEALPKPAEMQRIATEVGFSETAFIAPASGKIRTVRYYSPEAEVSFCGHATIATGVQLGQSEGEGTYRLSTMVGEVPVTVRSRDGYWEASLTSVDPKYTTASKDLVEEALSSLSWEWDDLDPSISPARAYAGAWHLILAVTDLKRLANLKYDFDALKELMLRDGLTTLQLVWREKADVFHARNPFPVGGVVEDPATGAAAAALGGYLRDAQLVAVPATLLIRQGEAMGCPSRLTVEIPTSGGIVVTGTAVPIETSLLERRMNDKEQINVDIRSWLQDDLTLLERLRGDADMNKYLGGPEASEKIRERQERYYQSSQTGENPMFVIVAGPERVPAGSIGYWEKEWQGQPIWETGWSVLPEFQGQGVATGAAMLIIERARAESKHRFLHAFPSVDNAPSNAICRKAGFILQGEADFEFPPGQMMRCNDWSLDLFDDASEKSST